MGFGLGGLVSSIGGFLGTSGGSALAQTVLNGYYNRKAASKQYGYTKSLIDYENQYNLPANQRARLEEAGYNPNLALNGVNVQSATGSAPQVKPTQLDLLSAYNLEAQNDLLKAQLGLTKATEEKTKAEEKRVDMQAEKTELENKVLQRRKKVIERTGIDPHDSGPVGWAASGANAIAEMYHKLERGTFHWLEDMFGKKQGGYREW